MITCYAPNEIAAMCRGGGKTMMVFDLIKRDMWELMGSPWVSPTLMDLAQDY